MKRVLLYVLFLLFGLKTLCADSFFTPPERAKGFTFQKTDEGTLLIVKDPWQGARSREYKYLLKPGEKENGNAFEVSVPVRRVVALSSSHLGYFERMGMLDLIVGLESKNMIYHSSLAGRIDEGTIAEVGGTANPNLEKIISLKPDLVLTYSIDENSLNWKHKLERAGIPVLVVAEYLEGSLLARAEWIRVFGALSSREDKANAEFRQMTRKMQDLEALAGKGMQTPEVMFNSLYGGSWYVPAGNSYFSKAVVSAGATHPWMNIDSRGIIALDFESVFAKCAKSDIWLNPGSYQTLLEMKEDDSRYSLFRPFRNKQVYNFDARTREGGGNDFFESGPAYPEKIFGDLVHLFHPELTPDHRLHYFRKLSR